MTDLHDGAFCMSGSWLPCHHRHLLLTSHGCCKFQPTISVQPPLEILTPDPDIRPNTSALSMICACKVLNSSIVLDIHQVRKLMAGLLRGRNK